MTKELNTDYTTPHIQRMSSRLNALRAGVLGANDGIISIAGLVIGVAGATSSRLTILSSGIAGLVAGALSMAVGEYVSVSSQRDSQRALLEIEREQLNENPQEELEELTQMYQMKGLQRSTAMQVAKELTDDDVFAAHAAIELNIDPKDLHNPWHAAIASAVSFTIGALIPVASIVLLPQNARIIGTFIAVLVALVITGTVTAKLGGVRKRYTIVRVLVGGIIAMLVTYAIGSLIGSSGR